MFIHIERRVVILLLAVIIVLGSFGFLFFGESYSSDGTQQVISTGNDPIPPASFSHVSFSSVQTGPMNAFPGQLINESYYLGSTDPTASYYEVTTTLNNSSYETLNVFPTYTSALDPAGYYLLFSFEMPNDQPGMWWTVGYQAIPVISTTIVSETDTILTNNGPVWMSVWTASPGNNYMIRGEVGFSSDYNATEVFLYPVNPQEASIVSTQVNSWKYVDNSIKVNFTLFESADSTNANTTPPSITASVVYSSASTLMTSGTPFLILPDLRVTLIQGNGAYLMGITSGQIAEITNSMNQTLSVPISQLNAAVVSINGDVAELQTSFGTMTTRLNTINATVSGIRSGFSYLNTTLGLVKTSLSSINATILSVQNGEATVITDVGIIQTSLSSLSTTVTSISAGDVLIDTDIGNITTSINSLNASFKGMNGTDVVIRTDIGSIETSLDSINATIFSIHLGMVEMNTSVGRIQVSLKSLNSSIIQISGDTAKIMTSAGEINATLSDLNTSIFDTSGGSPWLNDSYAYIETCLGNLTGTVTDVSNNTATIETNLGAVTASVDSIKSINNQGLGGDPPSLFDVIIIALLGVLIAIATLAMLGSRSTLKIMSDKVK